MHAWEGRGSQIIIPAVYDVVVVGIVHHFTYSPTPTPSLP